MPLKDTLEELRGPSGERWFPKTKFTDYTGLKGKTPRYLSIDFLRTYQTTHPELYDANMYLLRLGSGHFSLVESENILEEYFIEDSIFPEKGERYVSSASQQDIFSFSVMPKLTENTLLSLGLATGVIQACLGMDSEDPIPSPSEANGTYQFEVLNPHDAKPFLHDGQVEIDTVVFGKVKGAYTLFVIEGKEGKPSNSSTLAKHKLAYPVYALASQGNIPDYINIVPAYVRAWVEGNRIHYCAATFKLKGNPRNDPLSIRDVVVSSHPTHMYLQDIFSTGG